MNGAILRAVMLNPLERRAIEQKALEQAKQAAELARVEPELLIPTASLLAACAWVLSDDDVRFLRTNGIRPV